MKIRTTLLSLAVGAAGLILTTPTATAEEETPTPIAEVEGIAQFEAMLAKAEEFVAAGDDAEWSDFVTEDADTAWGLISGLAGSEDSAVVDGETVGVGEYVTGKLNGASAEVNLSLIHISEPTRPY